MDDIADRNEIRIDGNTTINRLDKIFKAAEQCQRAFQNITSSNIDKHQINARLPLLFAPPARHTAVSNITLDDVRDDYEQFRVWAKNLGVFAPDEASLDFRLREASELHDGLVVLLESLSGELTECLDLLEHDLPPCPDSQHVESLSSSDSGDSFASDQFSSRDTKRTAFELQIRLRHVTDIIDNLIRLASIIRSSSSTSRVSKSANYARLQDEDEKKITDQFENNYLPKILEHRFRLQEPLLSRFVKALSLRRRRFMYYASHQQRLAYGGELKEVSTVRPFKPIDRLQHGSALALEVPVPSHNTIIAAETIRSIPTRASTFQNIPPASTVPSRIISADTKYVADAPDVPPPPKVSNRDTHFQCPYCSILIPRRKLVPGQWKNHIIADLQPFLCLEPECPNADLVFKTSEDWIEHQRWVHAMEWWCEGESRDHQALKFSRENDYVDHIKSAHNIDKAMSIEKHVKTAGRPSLEPFSCCPLCDWTPQNGPITINAVPASVEETVYRQNETIKHISQELFRIFLVALPDRDDVDENDSVTNATVPVQSDRSALSEVSLDFNLHYSERVENESLSNYAPATAFDHSEDPNTHYVSWDYVWKSPLFKNSIRATYRGVDTDDLLRPFFSPSNGKAGRDHSLSWTKYGNAITKVYHDRAMRSRSENPDSGSWILQQRMMEDWLNGEFPKSPLVWMSGMPGAGKTVLASVIIEHCTQVLQHHHTAYFYCKHDDPSTLTSVAILKALLVQQMCWRNDLIPYFAEQKRSSGEPVLSSDRLAKALFTTACKGSERQYIIIDGIDECSSDQRANILDFLNTVTSDRDTQEPGKIRVLIVSRNEKDIRRLLGNAAELNLDEAENLQKHQRDIEFFVEQQARKIYTRFAIDEAVCQTFSIHLADVENRMRWIALQAAGQFLYAELVMKNLLAQSTQNEFFAEFGSDRLPKGLSEDYERIIARLQRNEHRWNDARLLLGLMTCAARPLKWHEIQGIQSIDWEREEVNFPLYSFRDDAVELCGSLITVHGDFVMFTHSTVKQFIAESTHIDLAAVECEIAAKCLRYLSFECFAHVPGDGSRAPNNQQDHHDYVTDGYFAFADYAVSKWMHHLVSVRNAAQTLLEESKWSGPEGREIVVQELEEAAEMFVNEHKPDHSDSSVQGSSTGSDNAYVEAVKPLFKDILNDGENVKTLLKYIMKTQSTPEGSNKIGLPSLERSFTRMRETVEDLVRHRATPREMIDELQSFYGKKLYKCGRVQCYFFHEGFADAKARDNHVRRHERPFQCPEPGCTSTDFGFTSKADLERHVVCFHPDAEIKARLFKIPKAVEKNRSTHYCEQCGKSFVRRSILNDHMLAHAGQKPYECRVCGRAFTRKNDCVRHEKAHETRLRH